MELNITILVQLVIFLLLLFFLWGWLFDPMMKLFDERERRIMGAASEAKRLAGAADETATRIETRTREAQDEARKVLTTLRAQATQREREIIEAAKEQANHRMVRRAWLAPSLCGAEATMSPSNSLTGGAGPAGRRSQFRVGLR